MSMESSLTNPPIQGVAPLDPVPKPVPILNAVPQAPLPTTYITVFIDDVAGFSDGVMSGAFQTVFQTPSGKVPTWSEICAQNNLLTSPLLNGLSPKHYTQTSEFWAVIEESSSSSLTGQIHIGVREINTPPNSMGKRTLYMAREIMRRYKHQRQSRVAIAWRAEVRFGPDVQWGMVAEEQKFWPLFATHLFSKPSDKAATIVACLVAVSPLFATNVAQAVGLLVLSLVIALGWSSFGAARTEAESRWRPDGWEKK